MSQTLTSTYVHLIFSTKNREPLLEDRDLRSEMHAYLGGICSALDSPALAVGGISDHVHLLLRQSKNHALKDIVQNLKQDSSKWVKRCHNMNHFYWQTGYGAFSVSPTLLEKVGQYILDQEKHHLTSGFQDELLMMLKKSNTAFDPVHLWS